MTTEELHQHIIRVGGRQAMAKQLGVSVHAVRLWRRGPTQVAAEIAAQIRAMPTSERRQGRLPNAPVMNHEELEACLAALGGVRSAARAVHVDPTTLRHYRGGRRQVAAAIADQLRAVAANIKAEN
jgi:DNA-binding transcriptional regulator YdaS (Cro superfamily)